MTTVATFRDAAFAWAVRGDPGARDVATELARGVDSVILVEGISDAVAVEALALRLGRDLAEEGVCVIPMGGVTNTANFARVLGGSGLDLRLSGLCDADREAHFQRALEREGVIPVDNRTAMEAAGFFVCIEDLEDELIRALGAARVEDLLEQQGERAVFRTFQNQPAQRGRVVEAQLRRFFGTIAGRKERYAKILVDGLDLARVPEPLIDVLRRSAASSPVVE